MRNSCSPSKLVSRSTGGGGGGAAALRAAMLAGTNLADGPLERRGDRDATGARAVRGREAAMSDWISLLRNVHIPSTNGGNGNGTEGHYRELLQQLL